MGQLPTGTLTMLFTDIEGSTAILSRLGDRYADVVSAHRAILRAAFRRWDGVELGTEGDSFFVVFRSAGSALAAARDAQRALIDATWPDGVVVRVRMGMHTGEPAVHDDGYVGMDVHRAARVASSAHGGQVVVSEATYRLVADEPVPGVTFADLGWHRLKDLGRPQRLWQLVADGLPAQFPRLKTLGSTSNLPVPTTSLVGRDGDVDRVRAAVGAGARLTTLTGPGGTGKTRLALAVAARLDDEHPDGVYFVPLASVSTGDVMWTTVAETLGLTGEDKAPPSLLEHLRQRRLLLVLDNLEQIAGASDVVAGLLAAAPAVQLLVTSRRPLHLTGEHEYAVEPLRVPAAHEPVVGGPGGQGAVELFVSRVRLVRPTFDPDPDDLEHVREICRSLDGLPLAIELVAARAKLLGPRALRARLDRRLELSRSEVDVPQRHRTLRATLDWSYHLLPVAAQTAFRHLGAFDGDFDLAATTAVVEADTDPLDVIADLVDASLLTVQEGPDGEPRLRMLRTVSLFAQQLLDQDADGDEIRRRHAEHYLGVARSASAELRGEHHVRARDALEREIGNLRAALEWSLRPGRRGDGVQRLELGLRMCEQLSWFWYGCGYPAEGRQWLQAAVDAVGEVRTPESIRALHGLGVLLLQEGHASRARDALSVCAAYWRECDDLPALSGELNSLGIAHRALGEPDTARSLVETAVDVAARAGDRAREANAVSNLAVLALDAGRTDEAIDLLRRSLDLDVELGDAWGQGADHVNLVSALLRSGRVAEARELLLEHAPSAVALGDVDITVNVLDLFCAVHALRGECERSARLLGATTRLRESAQLPMPPQDAAWMDGVLAAVRDRPTPDAWRTSLARGARYSVDDAVRDALAPSD